MAEAQMQKPELGLDEAFKIAQFSSAERDKKRAALRAAFAIAACGRPGQLYRLTEQSEFNDAVRERFASGWVDIGWARADGGWNTPMPKHVGADHALQREIKDRYCRCGPGSHFTPATEAHFIQEHEAPCGTDVLGEGGAPNQNELPLLIHAHQLTSAKEFLRTMLDGSAHILGATRSARASQWGSARGGPWRHFTRTR